MSSTQTTRWTLLPVLIATLIAQTATAERVEMNNDPSPLAVDSSQQQFAEGSITLFDTPEEESDEDSPTLGGPPVGSRIPMPNDRIASGCCKFYTLYDYQGEVQEVC